MIQFFFVIYSKPFSGDCSYELKSDSVKNNKVYLSGKYDSNGKCLTNGANDTINLGLFSAGTYTIYYSFIDIHGVFQTSVLSKVFTVIESTSLIGSYYKKIINLYPNPCDTYINISLLSDISKKTLVQLFNSTGQLEFENYIRIQNSELTIDMSNYKKGVYFLRYDNTKITEVKIIKK